MNHNLEESASKDAPFDPHAPNLSTRDWTIMAYFAGLGIIPLIAIVVVIYFVVSQNPNFENFPRKLPQKESVNPQILQKKNESPQANTINVNNQFGNHDEIVGIASIK